MKVNRSAPSQLVTAIDLCISTVLWKVLEWSVSGSHVTGSCINTIPGVGKEYGVEFGLQDGEKQRYATFFSAIVPNYRWNIVRVCTLVSLNIRIPYLPQALEFQLQLGLFVLKLSWILLVFIVFTLNVITTIVLEFFDSVGLCCLEIRMYVLYLNKATICDSNVFLKWFSQMYCERGSAMTKVEWRTIRVSRIFSSWPCLFHPVLVGYPED